MSEPMVLSFLVTVDATGDPRLYADLVRFRKGKPRVQRMRVLALQGVLSEGRAPTQGARPSKPAAAMGAVFGDPDDA
jgi:hypothetical protein